MAENFKLPGSSYDEFTKIILAYTSGKAGQAMSLDAVAQSASMDKTVVSRNNGFLVQSGLVSEGNQKAATELGIKLGRAYQLRMNDEIAKLWRDIIENDEFLLRMLSAIRIRKNMEKTAFVNHIVYSSGATAGKNSKTGALTLVELFKTAGFITEQDGQVSAVEEIVTVPEEAVPVDTIDVPAQTQNNHTNDHMVNAQSSICINININVSVTELDDLPEKVKNLIDSLKA